MSLSLYRDFEERYLPTTGETAKTFKVPESFEDRLLLLNIVQKYEGYRGNPGVRELNELLQHMIHKHFI